nr:DUF4173 domain-containing protein [Streptomyces sp. TP-A0874]
MPTWVTAVDPSKPAAAIGPDTLWAVLATAVLSAVLLDGDGLGLNLLLVALPAALAAAFAARTAGRRVRPWTLVWGIGGLALLAVPALRDAGWPSGLAVGAAVLLSSLALHGGRTWHGVLLGTVGTFGSVGPSLRWGWRGARVVLLKGSRGQWGRVIRALGVALLLLLVFGALFAGADAAFAELLDGLTPELAVDGTPLSALFFLLGLLGSLAAARTAAAPLRWDRIEFQPGRPRGRLEWALPLILLDVLFAAFIAVQLAVLFGGYRRVLEETGLTYAEYARQGFWQLLAVTLLSLVVIAFALRWAPRGGPGDRVLVRAVLGALCVLTLVVVAAALRRMDFYVDAYGLTRLRLSVAGVELWLGVVLVLAMVAGVVGGRWLPRAVLASAGAAVLLFGLLSPDALIAEHNVARYQRTGKIDVLYLQQLSADAVPALDRLPEPARSCSLLSLTRRIGPEAEEAAKPWYASSLGERRARALLHRRPAPKELSCWPLYENRVRGGAALGSGERPA